MRAEVAESNTVEVRSQLSLVLRPDPFDGRGRVFVDGQEVTSGCLEIRLRKVASALIVADEGEVVVVHRPLRLVGPDQRLATTTLHGRVEFVAVREAAEVPAWRDPAVP